MSRVFTGTITDYLSLADSLGITDYPFSAMVWVKRGAKNQYSYLFDHYQGVGAARSALFLQPAGEVRASCNQQFNASATATRALTEGAWEPVVMVVSSGSNGENVLHLSDQTATSSGTIGEYQGEASPTLYVGIGSNFGVSALEGRLSHLAFWKSALTAPQVSELLSGASAPSDVDTGNLLAYWPMTDGSLVDTVGGKTLAVTGTVANDDADNPPVSGGATIRPGIHIPDCYGPNADTFPADSAAVNYRMYDKQPDGTETLLGRGTDGDITAGAITIDNALAGSVDGTGWVDVFWASGADTLSWSGPYTVIDLDA